MRDNASSVRGWSCTMAYVHEEEAPPVGGGMGNGGGGGVSLLDIFLLLVVVLLLMGCGNCLCVCFVCARV